MARPGLRAALEPREAAPGPVMHRKDQISTSERGRIPRTTSLRRTGDSTMLVRCQLSSVRDRCGGVQDSRVSIPGGLTSSRPWSSD